MEDKVHIVPVGFEYERMLWGLERYGVTRIYVIRGVSELEHEIDYYVEKLKQRYSNLVETDNFREIFIDIFNLGEIFNVAKTIIETESLENQVYINISTATKLLAIGLTMAAWCADTDKMRYLPIIYYVRPKNYVQQLIPACYFKLKDLLKNFSEQKINKEEVYAFLKELEISFRDFMEKGSAWGREEIISIPFMPIKPPSEFEMQILAVLEMYGGEVRRIEDLVKDFDPNKFLKRGSKKPRLALRSKIAYHLRNLEKRQLVQRIPNRIGTKVRITDLGKVFITPRILKKTKEEFS